MEWKKIIIGEKETNYSVSNEGYVRNDTNNRILTNSLQQGYHHVGLTIDGKLRRFRVHRLVAIAFIGNPLNKPYVNHINGERNDNRVENLEWSTPSENTQHAFDTGLAKPTVTRKVVCYSLDGEKIASYESITTAAKATGSQDEKITSCCQGYRDSHNKYQWRYAEDEVDRLDKIEPKTYAKKVAQIKDGEIIAIYESYREAARAVKGTSSAISRVISGTKQTKTHKGFEWKLVDEIVH